MSTSQSNNNASGRIPIWLDCDPGHDDAFAIILAGHSNKLNVLGISTVAGNQTVEKTTVNALTTLHISGLNHIDVVKGQGTPLMRPSRVCPEIHGQTGLDCSVKLPSSTKAPLNKKAVLHIADVIAEAHDGAITLVATGCLTNYALLLNLYPELKPKIQQIVLLGGAMGIGNMSPVAEWNILIDPESARIVFESGLKIVMVPLEVTHTALVTPDILKRFEGLNSNFGKGLGGVFLVADFEVCCELLTFFGETYHRVFGFQYPPLHDPLAIAYLIAPEIFHTEFMRVDIETSSALCAGQTVCDLYHMSTLPKNAHVAQKVNVEKFWDLLLESVAAANKVSILNSMTLEKK